MCIRDRLCTVCILTAVQYILILIINILIFISVYFTEHLCFGKKIQFHSIVDKSEKIQVLITELGQIIFQEGNIITVLFSGRIT